MAVTGRRPLFLFMGATSIIIPASRASPAVTVGFHIDDVNGKRYAILYDSVIQLQGNGNGI